MPQSCTWPVWLLAVIDYIYQSYMCTNYQCIKYMLTLIPLVYNIPKRKKKQTIYHNTKQAAGNMEPASTRLFIKLASVRYTETCQCMPTKYMYIV